MPGCAFNARATYVASTADLVVRSFIKEDALTVSGLILAGPGPMKEQLAIAVPELDKRFKGKILAVLDTGYTGSVGLFEAIAKAAAVMNNARLSQERQLVSTLFKQMVTDTETIKRVAVGLQEVLFALENDAVQTLLVDMETSLKTIVVRSTKTTVAPASAASSSSSVSVKASAATTAQEPRVRVLNEGRADTAKTASNANNNNNSKDKKEVVLDKTDEKKVHMTGGVNSSWIASPSLTSVLTPTASPSPSSSTSSSSVASATVTLTRSATVYHVKESQLAKELARLESAKAKHDTIEVTSFVNWITDQAPKNGFSLELISRCSAESMQFSSGLGGLAAMLRYGLTSRTMWTRRRPTPPPLTTHLPLTTTNKRTPTPTRRPPPHPLPRLLPRPL